MSKYEVFGQTIILSDRYRSLLKSEKQRDKVCVFIVRFSKSPKCFVPEGYGPYFGIWGTPIYDRRPTEIITDEVCTVFLEY